MSKVCKTSLRETKSDEKWCKNVFWKVSSNYFVNIDLYFWMSQDLLLSSVPFPHADRTSKSVLKPIFAISFRQNVVVCPPSWTRFSPLFFTPFLVIFVTSFWQVLPNFNFVKIYLQILFLFYSFSSFIRFVQSFQSFLKRQREKCILFHSGLKTLAVGRSEAAPFMFPRPIATTLSSLLALMRDTSDDTSDATSTNRHMSSSSGKDVTFDI